LHAKLFRSAFARTFLVAALGAGAVFASTTSAAVTGGVDKAAEALVPASIKAKGTVLVAADASYAPNEFIASDGKTVIGMDADLAKAIFPLLGLKVSVVNA
jgi:polar amino acid transport system substrate-binding protein